MAKSATYEKRIIDVADYLYEHSGMKNGDVAAHFAKLYGVSTRQVQTYIKAAHKHNRGRIDRYEEAKDKALAKEGAKAIRRAILERDRALEILSSIAEGNAEGKLVPSFADRAKVISMLFEKMGWDEKPDDSNDTVIITFGS
jgi:hypothetical protein